MSKTIAETLRSAVRNSGLTLNQVAKRSGVPQPRLFAFMAGNDIRLRTAEKIAKLFDLELDKSRKKK